MPAIKEPINPFFSSNTGGRELYCGWEITTYTGKLNPDLILKKLKNNLAEWVLHTEYENNYFQNDFGDKVHLIFPEKTCNETTYKIILKSYVFGPKNEVKHKSLFNEVYSHIPWKKEGYWLKDNNLHIPIAIRKRLRRKSKK